MGKTLCSILLAFFCLLPCREIRAYEETDVKKTPACGVCGMSREAFAYSRMAIEYDDGPAVGTCSLNCTVAILTADPDRKPRSIRVADYDTKELIDAGNAAWVIGGKIPGVMTRNPKWAFGTREAADRFVAQNGGTPATFEQALKSAREERGPGSGSDRDKHSHAGHDMGPGAILKFNPAFGETVYHLHPAGMWMANFRFARTDMNGLRDGTTDVPVERVSPVGSSPYGYMMTPTKMTMDMYMLMAMYGVTDRLTLMAMGNYQSNTMDMLMNMGMGNVSQPPMRTDGFGDTDLAASYGIAKNLVGTLAIGIPTGGIGHTTTMMGMEFRAPYDMQTGSGTFDLKPSLTYNALSEGGTWNWGVQGTWIWRMGDNRNDYRLGDVLKGTAWLQRAVGPAALWLRLSYADTGRIHGSDPEIDKILDPVMGAPTPDADPANYGGQRFDGFLGVSIGEGPVSLGIEAGIPFYQSLNGLQLKTEWYLTAAVQAMF